MELAFCDACGFVSNLAFDPKLTEYSGRYEETQAYSGTFNKFHRALVERLIEDYDLRGKKILEIGCGKGEFLQMICELGQNRGVGFDPGFRPERLDPSAAERIKFIQDFYSDKYAHEKADFVCSKMTLEHITDAGNFIGGVRRAIGDNESFVFFQIPESTRILRDCAFEDIYYEHCSYYSPGSLARLFRRNGFDVLSLKTEYDEQYLTIEAKATSGKANGSKPLLTAENDLDSLRKLVADFGGRVKQKLEHWRNVLDDAKRHKKTVALWGSGSKGVSFLTSLGVTSEVAFVVDINPHRWNHYMSGTGHPIVGPSQLKELAPDVVIVMNPIYKGEIVADLNSNGLNPKVLTL
jgi:SAM-dependent methyltransferase